MAAKGVHSITADFEKALCDYTGAKYAVAVDNESNALFLCLYYFKYVKPIGTLDYWEHRAISIPARTYPSVPCEIIHAGYKVAFIPVQGTTLIGTYQLYPQPIWDSALRFTADMYIPGQFQCLSFTGPYKHLKLGKGGAILLDDLKAYEWLKKARFSGRGECSYHEDDFDKDKVIGWNFYMPVETAARGLHMITQFYNLDGSKKVNEDIELPYPDLNKFKCFR